MTTTTNTEIEAKIAELSADVEIATDEGTHGGPRNVTTYERLDGSRYHRVTHGGATIAVNGGDGKSSAGRMRHLTHMSAASRRAAIAELRRGK